MGTRPYVEVHRHGAAVRRVSWVTSVVSLDDVDGAGAFSVSFKAPLSDLEVDVRVGDHLVVRDLNMVADHWGIVTRLSGGYVSAANAAVSTDPLVASCTNPLAYLGGVTLSAPVGEADTVGTLFSVFDWASINESILGDFSTGNLGKALQRFFTLTANVNIPETLGGGTLGDSIVIVYDDVTAGWFAPRRVGTMEPVSSAAGASPSRLSFSFHESTVLDMLRGGFVPEPRLIELFFSLEDMGADEAQTLNVDPANPGFFGSAELATRANGLATALGRRPVLVYRLKPWRARALLEVVTSRDTDYAAIDKVHARAIAGENVAAKDLGAAAVRTVGAARARSAEASLLEKAYNQVTWDTTHPSVVRVPNDAVVRHTFGWDDASRVNATTINLSIDTTSGIEAWTSLGLPLRNPDSIQNHGLRIARPSWPYVLTDRSEAPDWVAHMRSVAATLMQFEQSSHLMASGEVRVTYDRVAAFRATPGVILSLNVPGRSSPFYAYVHAVRRETREDVDGRETQTTVVSYRRGLFGHEVLRDVQVLAPVLRAGARGATQGATYAGVTVPGTYNFPVSPPARESERVPGGSREYGAWLYQSAWANPQKAADQALRLGVSHLDVFVNGLSDVAFRMTDPTVVERAVALWRSAGLHTSLTTWVRPTDEWVTGVGQVAELARSVGAGLTLDVEDPWTIPAASMQPTQLDYWATALFDAIGAGVDVTGTGIVYVNPVLVQAVFSRCVRLVPQAYATRSTTTHFNMNPTAPPNGTLESVAVSRYRVFGKPLVMGAAAWALDGAYFRADVDALATSLFSSRQLGLGVRFWNFHMLVGTPQYADVARRFV